MIAKCEESMFDLALVQWQREFGSLPETDCDRDVFAAAVMVLEFQQRDPESLEPIPCCPGVLCG